MHTGGTQQFRLGQIGFLDLKQLQSPARTACSAPTSGAHICTRFLTTASFRRWNVASHRKRAALLASRRICRLQCHRTFDRVCNIDPAADDANEYQEASGSWPPRCGAEREHTNALAGELNGALLLTYVDLGAQISFDERQRGKASRASSTWTRTNPCCRIPDPVPVVVELPFTLSIFRRTAGVLAGFPTPRRRLRRQSISSATRFRASLCLTLNDMSDLGRCC